VSANPTVKQRKKLPVSALDSTLQTLASTRVDALDAGFVIQGVEHVGRNGRIMDVGASGYAWEEPLAHRESESVAHGVDEHIGNKEGKRIVGDYQRAQRLTEQCHIWI
jgi:hypothetical protein